MDDDTFDDIAAVLKQLLASIISSGAITITIAKYLQTLVIQTEDKAGYGKIFVDSHCLEFNWCNDRIFYADPHFNDKLCILVKSYIEHGLAYGAPIYGRSNPPRVFN